MYCVSGQSHSYVVVFKTMIAGQSSITNILDLSCRENCSLPATLTLFFIAACSQIHLQCTALFCIILITWYLIIDPLFHCTTLNYNISVYLCILTRQVNSEMANCMYIIYYYNYDKPIPPCQCLLEPVLNVW